MPKVGPDGSRPAPEGDGDGEHDRSAAVREVEGDLEELGDPEAGPGLPSGTLAAYSAVAGRTRIALSSVAGHDATGELLRLA